MGGIAAAGAAVVVAGAAAVWAAVAAVRTVVAVVSVAEDAVLTGEGLPGAVARVAAMATVALAAVAAAVEAGAAARVAAAAALPRVRRTVPPAVACAVLANREAFRAAGRVAAVDAASRNTAGALNAEESRHGIRAERTPSKYALNDTNRTTARRRLMWTSQASAGLVRESAQVASLSSACDDAT
jgi:hypothetical protein